MAPVKLTCPVNACGWKTDEVDTGEAMASYTLAEKMLNTHVAIDHKQEQTQAVVATGGCKPERMSRPKADLSMSESTWRDFEGQWARYKRSTKLVGQDLLDQLIASCSDPLRMDLRSGEGEKLDSLDEKQLIVAMKRMAVRESNPMVHRNNLRSVKQGENEPIRNYVARLRELVIDCDFSVKCAAEMCGGVVDYSEEMVRDQSVYGLNSSDTQAKVLALGSKLLPLEQVIAKAEAEEQARLTQTKLAGSAGTSVNTVEVSSVHDVKTVVDSQAQCVHCKLKGHGKFPDREVRQDKCPAWNRKCHQCDGLGHFKSACTKKKSGKDSKVAAVRVKDTNQAVGFNRLSLAEIRGVEEDGQKGFKMGHVEWDKEAAHWKQRQPRAMPRCVVDISVLTEEQATFFPSRRVGYENAGQLRGWVSTPDTGAQITVAGMALLNKLNIPARDLIPVSQTVTAANDSQLGIIGGILIKVTLKCEGVEVSTKQLCYISRECKGMFLSLSACKDLTIVHDKFPQPMGRAAAAVSIAGIGEQVGGVPVAAKAECGCPVRSKSPTLPSTMPYKAAERDKLEEWILKRYAASAFNVCTHQKFPGMSGPDLHIDVDPNAKPIAIHVPVPVPLHWQSEVKAGLDADVAIGVLEKVPPNTPITWLHRMVLTPKKDGSPRRTVDLSPLNRSCLRHTHHTRSPFHLASSIPEGTKKTCLDAWNGFHSVPLDEESKDLTCFITPWGVYRYCSCPMGFLASGDGYSHRYDNIVRDYGGLAKCVDDVALWGVDEEEIFWKTCKYLQLCAEHGIVLNPSKFQYAQDTIDFLGFEVTKNSVRPSPDMVESIRSFPAPRNISEVRSFFGLVNQVSFAFSMGEVMSPFRALLKPTTDFYWDTRLQGIFDRAKEQIVEEIKEGVRMFDPDKVTCLATDWSQCGVGYFLLQKHCSCEELKPTCCRDGWKLILAGSRFLKPNEERWAVVEGEALGVVYGLMKTRYYVLGCKKLIVATDHRPLLGVFGDKSLESVENPRLRRLKEKSLAYSFTMVHVPGRKHQGPDAMSRNPAMQEGLLEGSGTKDARQAVLAGLRMVDDDWDDEWVEDPAKTVAVAGLSSYVAPLAVKVFSVRAVTWERVQHETGVDPVLGQLTGMVETGFPEERNMLPDNLKEFYRHRDNLSLCDGVILFNWRVVVPRALRQEVLEGLHAGHQCVVGMKARAANSVFWPGIDAAIQNVRERCRVCNTIAPSQPDEPAVQSPPPQYPFQQVCCDYFELDGATYVVCVDRYSGWPSVYYYPRGTANSQALISTLREWWVLLGVPEECASDGGPTFVSRETQDFMDRWGVRHRLSSVAFPHSNTRAELGVKTCKRMIRENTGPKGTLDTDKFARALLAYRNTPLQGLGLSPAQILLGRELRDFLPFAEGKAGIRKEWRITSDERERALAKRHSLNVEKLNAYARELPQLKVGDAVFCQNQTGNYPRRWHKTGKVVEMGKGPRQYMVKMDGSGQVSLRNRKFLRKTQAVADAPDIEYLLTPGVDRAGVEGRQGDQEDLREQDDVLQVPAGMPQMPARPGPGVEETSSQLMDLVPTEEVQDVPGVGQGMPEGGRRYPARQRKENVRLKDYEVYGAEARSPDAGGRRKRSY